MQALKDNVSVDFGRDDAWRSACAGGWTVLVALAAAVLMRDVDGGMNGVALVAGGLVGALSTAPLWTAPAAPTTDESPTGASSTAAEASV